MGRNATVIGWWKVHFEISLDFEDEHERFGENFRFKDLSEVSREHILNCIKEGYTEGELTEDYELDTEEENPFKGREDERNCHCNFCSARFRVGEIRYKGDEEYCPVCELPGFIEDDPSCCYGCPKEECEDTPRNCNSPCPTCSEAHDCYNEKTEKRDECPPFIHFQKEVGCG